MRRNARTNAPAAPRGQTRAMVKKMCEGGMSVYEIAHVLNVWPQTVRYHIVKLRSEGELPSDAA